MGSFSVPIDNQREHNMSKQPLLVADIGGTKSLIALAERAGDHFRIHKKRYYENKKFNSGYDVLSEYIQSIGKVKNLHATLGIAGHIQKDSVYLTNRKWQFNKAQLEKDFDFISLNLVNDLEAMMKGVLFLNENDTIEIQKGIAREGGNICVIAAGTGLGEAVAVYCKEINDYHIIPSEVSQADFSAANEVESELWNYTRKHKPGASIETLLSGSGLIKIYQYLIHKVELEDINLTQFLEMENPAGEITKRANSGEDEYCKKAVDIFISIYANEARNFAFRMLPYGGIFIGGGIAPKIFGEKDSSGFLQRKEIFLRTFLRESKMENFLENVPIYIINSEDTVLYGAASFAESK